MYGDHLLLLSHAAVGGPADQILRLTAAPATPHPSIPDPAPVHPADARRAARRRWQQAAEDLCRALNEQVQPMTSRIIATRGASAGGIA